MRAEKTEAMKAKQKEKASESLLEDKTSQATDIVQEALAITEPPSKSRAFTQESMAVNESPSQAIETAEESLAVNESPSRAIEIAEESLALNESPSRANENSKEPLGVDETPLQATDTTQEALVELSDGEILKLVREARNKINALQGTLVQKEIKTEMESIFINVSPLEKIKEIQLALGKKLTE